MSTINGFPDTVVAILYMHCTEYRWSPDPHAWRGNLEGERDQTGHARRCRR